MNEQTGARCLTCSYQLRGLTSRRCPECGRNFDPDDPWTVWLPDRPNCLVRWLMRRPTVVGRAFPWLAVLAVAWGSRIPGWSHPALKLAFLLVGACALSALVRDTMIRSIHRRGYSDRGADVELRRFARRLRRATIIALALILLRPSMFVCFWISRPWLERVARGIDAQPFSQSTPYIGQPRGMYFIHGTRRCPHGVKLNLAGQAYWDQRDDGPGFFRRTDPGQCVRFDLGIPLGGGWYASG